MNWLNLNIETLTREEFLGAEPLDRATWLCMSRYCAEHETGGVIVDCDAWGDRKWQQLLGVTKDETRRQCKLWTWTGLNVTVAFYPVDQERAAQAKRVAGKTFGRCKHPAQLSDPPAIRSATSSAIPPTPPSENDKDKGKGKGNGKPQLSAQHIAELKAELSNHPATVSAILVSEDTDAASALETLRALRPEYATLDASAFMSAWKIEPDSKARALAYSEALAALAGKVETDGDPLRLIRGYLRNARRHGASISTERTF